MSARRSRGLDAAGRSTTATLHAIWRTIDRYAVLVLHDQHLTDRELHDFAARFGELEIGRSAYAARRRRLAIPQIGDISNLDEDNRVRARDDRRRLDSLGNRLWHTDASYMPVPVVLGMLFAVELPPASPWGAGETEFADMRAAYDALTETQKKAIDDLVVEHDVFWSRGRSALPNSRPASASSSRRRASASCAAIRRRAARRCTCRRTPRTSLAGRCPRGGCCSRDLTEHATQRQFVYSHKWRVGDLVIWDNRDTMHRGRPHDEVAAARPAPRDDARYRLDPRRGGLSADGLRPHGF